MEKSIAESLRTIPQIEKRVLIHPYSCPGAFAESGKRINECYAIHAEQNALLKCKDVYSIDTCYTTTSPCITCIKLLMNTSCKRIVFLEEYSNIDARDLWLSMGRIWERYDDHSLLSNVRIHEKFEDPDAT